MRQKQRDEEEKETGRDRQTEGGGRSVEVWVKRLSESDRGERERSGKTLPLAKVRALSLIYRCSLTRHATHAYKWRTTTLLRQWLVKR